MENIFTDEYFMREALKEARKAAENDEVPVGAVVVLNNRIIARGNNMTEKLNDCTAHAEMLAITAAENFLGSKYLKDCKLYVTLEPCVMCAGALYWSQISEVIYAADDEKRGYRKISNSILHPKTILKTGIMKEDAANLLVDFFKRRR
jgi:tRNA(adenine34) deaminase